MSPEKRIKKPGIVVEDVRRRKHIAGEQPAAYALAHYRMGPDCYWGPFADLDEVRAFQKANDVRGVLLPLYKTVDWTRE